MQKTVLSALLITITAVANGAAPAAVQAPQKDAVVSGSTSLECGPNEQAALVAALHLGKDSKGNPDACAPILDGLLTKVAPKDKFIEKALVRAIERKTQALAVTFKTAPGRVVDIFTLRAHKKDTGGVDFRYGSAIAADKAWSDWKTRYVDAIDCDEDADRAVADTHLKVPAVGHMVCAGAFGRAVLQYNQRVIQNRPGVVEWNGSVINASAIASVRIQQTTWAVFDGSREVFTANVYKVKASSMTDANRQPWEAIYGKKVSADEAKSELAAAMGAAMSTMTTQEATSTKK